MERFGGFDGLFCRCIGVIFGSLTLHVCRLVECSADEHSSFADIYDSFADIYDSFADILDPFAKI